MEDDYFILQLLCKCISWCCVPERDVREVRVAREGVGRDVGFLQALLVWCLHVNNESVENHLSTSQPNISYFCVKPGYP